MRKIRARIVQLARCDLPLLVGGESGTGKELVVRIVYELSGVRHIVVVSSASFPHDLIDSELFGSVVGAFTNAVNRDGLIAAANGGILFLDELQELSLTAQAKLLRVVECGEYRPLGSVGSRRSLFRLLAATNEDIDVPPLRERPEDIPVIGRSVLQQCRQRAGSGPTELSAAAQKLLMDQPWPGNVRELRSVLELVAVLAGAVDVLEAEHLAECLPNGVGGHAALVPAPDLPLPTLRESRSIHDRELVQEALRRTGGNHAAAARMLRTSPATLYRLLGADR